MSDGVIFLVLLLALQVIRITSATRIWIALEGDA